MMGVNPTKDQWDYIQSPKPLCAYLFCENIENKDLKNLNPSPSVPVYNGEAHNVIALLFPFINMHYDFHFLKKIELVHWVLVDGI